jgi:hypothetical protein
MSERAWRTITWLLFGACCLLAFGAFSFAMALLAAG